MSEFRTLRWRRCFLWRTTGVLLLSCCLTATCFIRWRTGGSDLHSLKVLDIEGNRAIGASDYEAGSNVIWLGRDDGAVQKYDCGIGQLLTVTVLPSYVRLLVASRGDGLLAATLDETGVFLIDKHLGKRAVRIASEAGIIRSCGLLPDNRRMVLIADGLRKVVLWDVVTDRQIGTLDSGKDETITGITISPDGNKVAGCLYHGSIVVWDLQTQLRISESNHHKIQVFQLNWQADDIISSLGMDGQFVAWNHKKDTVEYAFAASESGLDWACFAVSSRGDKVAIGFYDGVLSVFDSRSGKRLYGTNAFCGTSVGFVAFSRTKELIAINAAEDLQDQRTPGQIKSWQLGDILKQ